MKFSLILAAAVAFNNALGAFAGPIGVTYGPYEITKPNTLNGITAAVLSTEPFVVDILFVTPNSTSVFAGVYTNAGPDGCGSGTRLAKSLYSFKADEGWDKGIFGLVTTDASNAPVYTGKVTIPDVAALATNGTVNLCARLGYGSDISYMDTYVNVNVTTLSSFANFTTGVNITTTAADELNTNMTKNVKVEGKLCANNTSPLPQYKIGKSFMVCVNSLDPKYLVKGFKDVTCSNTAYTRSIFQKYVPQALSSEVDTVGANLLAKGGIPVVNTTAFESVIVAGYFLGGSKNFTCSGEVALYKKEGQGRRMLQRFEFGLDDATRLLQETETGKFEAEVGLEDEVIDILEAGASMASIIGTAGLMVLSALMVLVM